MGAGEVKTARGRSEEGRGEDDGRGRSEAGGTAKTTESGEVKLGARRRRRISAE